MNSPKGDQLGIGAQGDTTGTTMGTDGTDAISNLGLDMIPTELV
jgi:hypothetical protein